jgi:hypothetical protein
MSYQEKQTIVAIISNLLTSGAYFFYLSQNPQARDLNAELDLKFWASIVLIYLLVLIVFRIIIYIIFSIMNTIITREEEPKFTDEMDTLIDMKSAIYFYHLFIIGVFLSVGSLLVGLPDASIFIGILLSMFISGLFMELWRLYFYRKGV